MVLCMFYLCMFTSLSWRGQILGTGIISSVQYVPKRQPGIFTVLKLYILTWDKGKSTCV